MEEFVGSKIDLSGPIDLQEIEEDIKQFGPLRIAQAGNPFKLILHVTPCRCGKENCVKKVVTVHRIVGLSQISWVMDVEELGEFESLNDFYRYAQIFGPVTSSGERQLIERHIKEGLGTEYFEVIHPYCNCKSCADEMGDVELWKRHLLTTLAISLQNLSKVAYQIDEEDHSNFMADFDAGYSLGRLVGEYFLKARVEEDALRGIAAKGAEKARTVASGLSSAQKKACAN
jgi:hypothetical protein